MPQSPHPRHKSPWLPGFALLAGLAALSGGQTPPAKGPTAAVPPKSAFTDEQEDPNAPKVRKKIAVEDEGPPPVTVPKGAFYVRVEDLFRAVNDARHPAIRELLSRYTVAFDRIIENDDQVRRV